MWRFASQLRSFVRTALRGLAASPVTTGIAMITIAVTLVLAGAFALVLQNMQELVREFGDDLRVTVYLQDGLTDAQREDLAERVRSAPGVASVHAVSKQEALHRFEAGVGSRTGLLEALEENPLPASLEITPRSERRSAGELRSIAESIEGLRGIEEVAYGQEWVEGYARALELLRGVGLGLGAVLALATLLIVANTIRLVVYARRDELEILELVGASRVFMSAPFLLEGLIQGAAGAALAVTFLYALFQIALPGLEGGWQFLLGYAQPAFLSGRAMLGLLAAGSALGVLGSVGALIGSWQR